ncbi:MAG: NADase-type glycan-binding domain-containing protein [Spirochaetia bacterium]
MYETPEGDAYFEFSQTESGDIVFRGEAYTQNEENPENIRFGEVSGSVVFKNGRGEWKDGSGNSLTFSFQNRTLEVVETGNLGGLGVSFTETYEQSETVSPPDSEETHIIFGKEFTRIGTYGTTVITFNRDGSFLWKEVQPQEPEDHITERKGTFRIEKTERGKMIHTDDESWYYIYDQGILVLYTPDMITGVFSDPDNSLTAIEYDFSGAYEVYPSDIQSPYFDTADYFAEGAEGSGSGVTLYFGFPDTVKISKMVLFNGVTRNYTEFKQKNRIKTFEMKLDQEKIFQKAVPDSWEPAVISLPSAKGENLEMTVKEVYQGTGDENMLCVSKILFFGPGLP